MITLPLRPVSCSSWIVNSAILIISDGYNNENSKRKKQGKHSADKSGGQELVKYGCVAFAGEANDTSASGGTV
jgi:CRISPR/Cas system type I-B associated protein Csh2 (Cas7 group RAMP superfamily)